MAKFRDHDGRIVTRTTKQRKRPAAQLIANEWEHARKAARAGELTRAVIQNTMSWMMERTIGESLDRRPIRQYLADWLKAGERSRGTVARYEPVLDGFVEFIGKRRAAANVASVTTTEIERFRDQQIAEGKTPSTANLAVKVLRAAFGAARRLGVALTNPADGVELLNESESEERIPFTAEQSRQLLQHADDEWRGMILFGYHTAMRIGDAARLTWKNIDLVEQTVSFRDAKTSRRKKKSKKITTICLHEDVVDYLEKLPAVDVADAPLFPSLATKSTGSHAGLSKEFNRLMSKAGIRAPVGPEKQVKAGGSRRSGFTASVTRSSAIWQMLTCRPRFGRRLPVTPATTSTDGMSTSI
ncbi:MAG: tyrosine-type recombinase/integrase [Chthoniobacterales bacterium]|nr:tyrosine-type recombinase/integrase [Chthoniobacterales bacterium]